MTYAPSMYIDIEAGIIGDEPIIGTFKETGPGAAIRAVRLEFPDGWHWCEVVGWSETGMMPATLTPIEESGDGPALLLHGGNHGLRLRRGGDTAGDATASSPATTGHEAESGEQTWWSEGFMILRPGIERR